MRPRSIPCLAPLLASLLSGAPGCSVLEGLAGSIERPTARLAGARIADLSLRSLTLVFDVEVSNPYAVPLPLVKASYGLSSGGTRVLSGDAEPGGTVPARASRTIALPATIAFAGLLGALRDTRPGSVVPYEADLALSVDAPGAGALTLPLRKEGELPVPAAPEVSIAGFRWGEVGLDRATAVLGLRIKNTNGFPVDLSGLSYALAISGKEVAKGSVDEPVSFAPGADGGIDLSVSFAPATLGLGALGGIAGGSVPWRLSGTMALGTPFGRLEAPFERSGETSLGK